MRTLFARGLVAGVVAFVVGAVCSGSVAQTVLVNTGPGSGSTIGAPSLFKSGSIYQYLGAKFTLASGATIGTIEGWMARPSGTINVKIYSNNVSNKPGTELFSGAFAGTGSATPAWASFSGVSWALSAGTYWVTFEPTRGSGSMPNGAASPLLSHAFQANDSSGWQLQSASAGIKITSVAPPLDIHVPADFSTIQAAITAAANGQTVIVSAGTYAEAINFNNKAITVKSASGAATTTIDATGLGLSVVRCISGETSASTLDGFTLTGGAGTLVSGAHRGGGIYCLSSSPTIKNCIITGNDVDNIGGGMRCTTSSPTLINCTFDDNSAINGGAVSNGAVSNPSFTGCTFIENSSLSTGGAIDNAFSSPTFLNCSFTTNDSGSGGAVNNANTCNPSFTGCSFDGNTAGTGSVMYSNISCNATFSNCTFNDNIASFASTVFLMDHCSGSYTGCTFEDNDGDNFAGAIYAGTVSSPTISNCQFRNNGAGSGGAIYSEADCNPPVSGSLFCGNTVNNIFGPWNNQGSNTFNLACTASTGDLNGDGHVNVTDLLSVIGGWGNCPTAPASCLGDVNGDHAVNVTDLLAVIGNWG